MALVSELKDKIQRHKERHANLDYDLVLSDKIELLNIDDWQTVAHQNSFFLSYQYLAMLQRHQPDNVTPRFAIAYQNGIPVVIVCCQITQLSAANLSTKSSSLVEKVAKNYSENILVCGNMLSSGLDGFAVSEHIENSLGWRILADVLYKIRRAEKLNHRINVTLIKDIKQDLYASSTLLERYSYRPIKTDPDMQLSLAKEIKSFDDYLMTLTSKYRNRARKVIKTLDSVGCTIEKLTLDKALDRELHQLYMNVEAQSSVRPASLKRGYFYAMSQLLQNNFVCYGIKKDGELLGFISIIKDQQMAFGYYVGIDYSKAAGLPIYFRLLQLAVNAAIEWQVPKLSLGRTALEPKANLGAKPVDSFIWGRHRKPLVNSILRQFFGLIPHQEAPERQSLKT
ncbi:GNAT family N-acetyltransferase [Aliikangiella sp. IMCC44653]